MINYIGDISKRDAIALREYAFKSERILEFGCGASTQILTKYTTGNVTSIDTSIEWIDITKRNLLLLEIEGDVQFVEYDKFMSYTGRGSYDFIFVDGVDALRREFALKAWNRLDIGGKMAFHDTRRGPDARNFIEVVATHFNEINHITLNIGGSNISVFEKKEGEPWENWQITEKKEPWMLGYGPAPLDENGNILWPKT